MINDLLKKKIEVKPMTLYFFVSISGILVSFVISLSRWAGPVNWFDMGGVASRRFMDFYGHFGFSSKKQELYHYATGTWGCFPPINYVIYYPLYLISGGSPGLIPDEVLATTNFELITHYIENYMPVAPLTFMYYCIIVSLVLYSTITDIGKKNKMISTLLFLSLMFSAEFLWGTLQRGNAAMIVIVLMLVSLHWKDSDKRWKREIALLLMALVAAMKLYPAIFGLLYLKEKRWKEAIRLTIYGLLLVFVPFVFFGGIEAMKLWFGSLMEISEVFRIGRINYVSGVVDTIAFYLSGGTITTGLGVISKMISICYLVLMIFLALISKNRYRTMFFLCCAMTFFPVNAYRYTLAYLSLPLIFYIKEEPDEKPWIIMFLFGLLFSMPGLYGMMGQWLIEGIVFFGSTAMDEYLYSIAYLLGFVVIIREILSFIHSRKIVSDEVSSSI